MCTSVSNVFKDLQLENEELKVVESIFSEVTYKKGDTILHTNEKVYYQYYVVKGCLRTFFMDAKGKEHTIQFAINDWWISDYIGYFSESESVLSIECITDATVLKVAKSDLDSIYEKVPKIEHFFRKKLERSTVRFQKRILNNLVLSAKERYHLFLQTYPNIEQQIKNYHLASYLGITTESLSRIRKEIL
ncbi:Crp/Fnr family transcriptional regulator [uncultured Tenacibaculum sp.]|uniref:Crp/Fnr family transcriptional regulator n=1 Tax=uncultured Tenacibaculum sp. TaxID=174713 RepID=UPI002620AD44|nr:Crp/Fnr family transcriptional regulator [uncultured Tenacibaculum sp.]